MRIRFDNAWVHDGFGTDPYLGSVGVADGRIAFATPDPNPPELEGAEIVDVARRAIAPGFIDMHSHSDLAIMVDDFPEAKLLQGVTTEVIGQDGFGYAPVTTGVLEDLRDRLAAWNGRPEQLRWHWRSVAELLRELRGSRVNVAYLVPHSTLRLDVGAATDSVPSPSQRRRMLDLLAEGLADGAVGMSAGLGYVPGLYASRSELERLCEVLVEQDAYFCPHHRSYGRGALEAFEECVEIARRTGVRLHLAHAHLSFPENQHRSIELIELFESARQDGVELTFDSYPYDASMTSLAALLPPWALEGGTDEIIERLEDPSARERVRVALDEDGSAGYQYLKVDWDRVVVSGVGSHAEPECVGLTIMEIANAQAVPPWLAFVELLIRTRLESSCILRIGYEHNVRALLALPYHTIGSDGILTGSLPHPRGWGAVARLVGRYVRDEPVLSLPEAIRHVTSSPARVLRADDIGAIEPGRRADLVVFDPAAIRDLARYDSPREPAQGVEHVLIGGRFAVRDGLLGEAGLGRVVTRSAA